MLRSLVTCMYRDNSGVGTTFADHAIRLPDGRLHAFFVQLAQWYEHSIKSSDQFCFVVILRCFPRFLVSTSPGPAGTQWLKLSNPFMHEEGWMTAWDPKQEGGKPGVTKFTCAQSVQAACSFDTGRAAQVICLGSRSMSLNSVSSLTCPMSLPPTLACIRPQVKTTTAVLVPYQGPALQPGLQQPGAPVGSRKHLRGSA